MGWKDDQNYIALFGILSAAIYGRELPVLPEGTDYGWIRDELKAQALLPVTAAVFKQLPPGDELRKEWQADIARDISTMCQVQRGERRLTSLLREAGIPCAIIKGSAAAVYYPESVFRCYGDTDIMVPPDRYEEAAELMRENGYRMKEGNESYTRHTAFFRGTHEIELHRYFFNDTAYERLITEAFPRVEIYKGTDNETPVFPDEINGLILLEHIRHHLQSSGLGFRQVIDWLMFVKTRCDDDYWQNTFAPLAEKAGLRDFACVVTKAAFDCFGAPEGTTWVDEADAETADMFIEHLMKSGNFGRKRREDERSLFTITSKNLTFFGWLKYLQYAGCVNWKLAQRCAVVRPFAWLYQIGRYVVLGIKTRRLAGFVRDGQLGEAKKARELKARLIGSDAPK